ncbi:MAG TPA: NAD(P)H-dependent oxidoreductase subunit E [Candidatus Fimiplasma intestinipullorum]|uniref:NAD(P)H-dependent oxidoreductase subunit E n=1 Tax=Candidatus Fimiplasma intestinipullorum TaxID=2840825 RepID=A0A9D1HML1_9FIRM|nr:NAD(P)H-dependent oxidoreductase subunit E [Candidatus Fimiplasma intestinipullorum]
MKKLNQASIATIESIVAKHKGKMGPIKLMLHDVQDQLGYIPFEAMEMIAKATGEPISKVYGVVTFYSQFTTEPKGKHVISVCLGTACYVNGSQTILDLLVSMTGAPVNGTSPNGLFSIDATRCVGACGLAPVVSVDGTVFGCKKQLDELKLLVLEYMKEESNEVSPN